MEARPHHKVDLFPHWKNWRVELDLWLKTEGLWRLAKLCVCEVQHNLFEAHWEHWVDECNKCNVFWPKCSNGIGLYSIKRGHTILPLVSCYIYFFYILGSHRITFMMEYSHVRNRLLAERSCSCRHGSSMSGNASPAVIVICPRTGQTGLTGPKVWKAIAVIKVDDSRCSSRPVVPCRT